MIQGTTQIRSTAGRSATEAGQCTRTFHIHSSLPADLCSFYTVLLSLSNLQLLILMWVTPCLVWKWLAEPRCRSRLRWACTAHGMFSQQHSAVWNHNQFMLLFKHMPYDEFLKAVIKNIAYTVVRQAARPVQATTASQTVNQLIPKVIFPLKISAVKLRLLPWATIISYQALHSSLCYSEWEMCLAFTTRKNPHAL